MTAESDRATRLDDPGARTILGDDGRYWTVHEAGPGRYDRRTSTSLVFWSDDIVMRRVRDFPPNWRDLSDSALYALMLRP